MSAAVNNRFVIQLRDLAKTYQTGEIEVKAVRGITLDIDRGDFVAIMGASGSGKSTLMNMLGCLDQPTGGSYLLDDIAVAGLGRKAPGKIAEQEDRFRVPELQPPGPHLRAGECGVADVLQPPLTSLRDRRRRALQALQQVGLGDRLSHHTSQLSGGQQQRIAIARALINRPELVLADEPTGNLDTRTSIEIMGLFQELNESGITLIMVTHELDIAAYCKRIVVMRDGRVISDTRNEDRRFSPGSKSPSSMKPSKRQNSPDYVQPHPESC